MYQAIKGTDGFYPYPTCVEDIAKVLDVDVPKWWERVNLSALNMRDSEYCPFGQVYQHKDAWIQQAGRLFDVKRFGKGQFLYIHTFPADKINGYILANEAYAMDWRAAIKQRENQQQIPISVNIPSIQLNYNGQTLNINIKDVPRIIAELQKVIL